jgi:hypothetical protein
VPNKIERLSSSGSLIELTDSVATTPNVHYGAVAGGMVFVSAASGASTILWYAAPQASGEFVPVYSSGEASETAVSPGRAYPIPDACFAAPFLKMVLDAGTASVFVSVKG